MNRAITTLGLLMFLGALLSGCAPGATSFVRDDVDYSFVQRVGVYPFQNRSQDAQAGARVYSVFLSELLARSELQVLELGEVLSGLRALRLDSAAELSPEQIVALGKELDVQAIFFGAVEDYGLERVSNDRVYTVTFTFSLAETETGSLIWQSQVHDDGTSVWRKLFGGGSASQHAVTCGAVRDALGTLF